MDLLFEEKTVQAVRHLKDELQKLAGILALSSKDQITEWGSTIEKRLLERLRPDFPLVAAICGGGSSGKSSLFNSLSNAWVSPVGGKAGINKRVLMSINTGLARDIHMLNALFEPFGSLAAPLEDKTDLQTKGQPLYTAGDRVPSHIVLLDTPDFDTGAKGVYQNRDAAREALGAADILIYVFTNANYNNKDNTDFIQSMLNRVGIRKCFLVYRVSAALSDETVRQHAGIVSNHLYPDHADKHVLGVYRTDEDNAVASQKQWMQVRPIQASQPGFEEALARLDPRQMKIELHRSTFISMMDTATAFLDQCRCAALELRVYLDALRAKQGLCVKEALGHFPMDEVMKRFARIWTASDPAHIKAMRKTGQVVEAPYKLILKAVRWVRGPSGNRVKNKAVDRFEDRVDTDLLAAANMLYNAAVNDSIVLSLPADEPISIKMKQVIEELNSRTPGRLTGNQFIIDPSDPGLVKFTVSAPLAISSLQNQLKGGVWKNTLDILLSRKDIILGLSSALEENLNDLAADIRENMDLKDQVRQTFSAFLNIIPATAAVTYILHTGDAAGAVGIKVKLTGLFGLNDLCALVAIPATSGMKKADRKQLEKLLVPVAKAWLDHKLVDIHKLFETHITGDIIKNGKQSLLTVEQLITTIETHLKTCTPAMEAIQ